MFSSNKFNIYNIWYHENISLEKSCLHLVGFLNDWSMKGDAKEMDWYLSGLLFHSKNGLADGFYYNSILDK